MHWEGAGRVSPICGTKTERVDFAEELGQDM